MAKAFTLEDLIEYEVSKRLKGKAETGWGEMDFFKAINSLLKLIKEIQKLQAMQPQQPVPQPQPQPQPQEQKQGINLDGKTIVQMIDNTINVILSTYGDIPLSEVKRILHENREALENLIEQQLKPMAKT
jgi:hypothetical protein